jgi:hypothetical protein
VASDLCPISKSWCGSSSSVLIPKVSNEYLGASSEGPSPVGMYGGGRKYP